MREKQPALLRLLRLCDKTSIIVISHPMQETTTGAQSERPAKISEGK
jgi:hypothetical protein